MLPEVLESIEDLIEILTPLFALVVLTIGTYFTVKVWRGRGASYKTLESIDDKLTLLLEHSDSVRGELSDIQDRVEFTERLLTDKQNVGKFPEAHDRG
jgi:hypothetical protein